MKKKFRTIKVGGVEYGWVIKFDGDGDGGVELKIYQNKKLIRDFYPVKREAVTPGLVANIIRRMDDAKKSGKEFMEMLLNGNEPLYTLQQCRENGVKYGVVHAADNESLTRCKKMIDSNWFILTNHRGDGTVTCKRCSKASNEG